MRATQLTILILIGLATVLLCVPRFNRHDGGTLKHYTSSGNIHAVNPDSTQYLAYTQYFRGDRTRLSILDAPFTYRPIGPLLASRLPLSPATALNVLNVLAILGALTALYGILAHLGFPFGWRALGCAMLGISFPTFYYGTITYIDPLLLFVMTLGVLLIVHGRWWALLPVVVLGVLVKETAILLLPMAFAHAVFSRQLTTTRIFLLTATSVLALAMLVSVRLLAPGGAGFAWMPSLETFTMNVVRWRAWVSVALTFGAPGLLALGALRPMLRRDAAFLHTYGGLATGFLLALAVCLYSVSSAYLDGRLIWFASPIAIPLALAVLANKRSPRDTPQTTPSFTR